MTRLKSLISTGLLVSVICETTTVIAAEVQCLEDQIVCYNPSLIPDRTQRRRETGSVKDEEGSVSRGGRMRGGRMRGGRMRGGRMRGNPFDISGSRLEKGLARVFKQQDTLSTEAMPLPQKVPDIIAPLAPQHTGFTVTAQPTLYWYMSEPWHGEIQWFLNEVSVAKPLLELKTSLSKFAYHDNLYRLNLTDYGVSLEPHKEYEWFVTIERDPEQPSIDAFGSGTIRYQMPSKGLTERLNNTLPTEWYRVYAEEGIWYDSIDNLSRQIENQPQNKGLRKARVDLIEQVDMPKVAQSDRTVFN